jgi:hypothetical protein
MIYPPRKRLLQASLFVIQPENPNFVKQRGLPFSGKERPALELRNLSGGLPFCSEDGLHEKGATPR